MNRYEALKHAVKAHAGQVDRCGQPYVLHPIAVAEAIPMKCPIPGEARIWAQGQRQEEVEVVALLHDVWEDTDYDLPAGDLTYAQIEALQQLTRQSGQLYADYIAELADAPPAAIVKLADLHHNLQPERQACLPAKERASLEKRYLKAREQIWEALGYRWWPEPLERSDD